MSNANVDSDFSIFDIGFIFIIVCLVLAVRFVIKYLFVCITDFFFFLVLFLHVSFDKHLILSLNRAHVRERKTTRPVFDLNE